MVNKINRLICTFTHQLKTWVHNSGLLNICILKIIPFTYLVPILGNGVGTFGACVTHLKIDAFLFPE